MSRSWYPVAVLVISLLIPAAASASNLDDMGKSKEYPSPRISSARGSLDCSNVIDLYDGYHDPSLYLPAVSNVDEWPGESAVYTGGEVVFHVTFPDSPYGWTWTLIYTIPGGGQVDCFRMSQGCDETYTESHRAGVDPTTIVHGYWNWHGELWLALDGRDGYGDVSLDVSFGMTEYIADDFCADVIEIPNSSVFTGDTCDGYNTDPLWCEIMPPTEAQYTTRGWEDYYGVFMPAGSTFHAHLYHSCDASMRLMDACMAPMNCIGYVDYYYSGNPPELEEVMTFTNASGADAQFYLVIDAYDFCCGPYDLEFQSDDGAVINEEMSFGDVKRVYR